MAASSISSQARFHSFDSVLQGCKGYSHNLVNLQPIIGMPIPYEVAFDRLFRKISDVIQAIGIAQIGHISAVTIGKTHARQRTNCLFDPMNPNTWRLDNGINGRWNNYYKEEGYNALVAIVCITKGQVPFSQMGHTLRDQQQYAISLEQRLIAKLVYDFPYIPVGNESFDPGCSTKSPPKAGIVYLAFKATLAPVVLTLPPPPPGSTLRSHPGHIQV